ncbi:MAG: diapophytoene dehydrogenase [Candidatus Marinimicrobia bacterium]|nr:diapophytoene dehydrogenase [Candidatus Neomarinimicrobiota bacterium]
MATDIIMPKMGESITEGTITEWKMNVGDTVKKDETILEISTDKVDSEVPSPATGEIISILFDANETVEVGTVIGVIGEKGEKINKEDNSEKSDLKDKDLIDTNKNITSSIEIPSNKPDIDLKNDYKVSSRFYSPLVRSIAKKEGLHLTELDNILGTGRGGRVNKLDILSYLKSKETSSSHDAITVNEESKKSRVPLSQDLDSKVEVMDPIRKKISEHMIQSQSISAHVYSTIDIDVTNLLKVKKTYSEVYKDKHSIKLTVTSLLIDACIKALSEFPLLNTSIVDTNIVHHKNINMGVAVALEDNNLIVPVIKSSEELNLIGLSRSLEDLSVRARNKQLDLEEVQGSTFTITNPGVFGGLFGIPIINQPNVGILSIGKIQKKPVVKETNFGDSIVIRSMMYVTLGYDHRLIDGAYGTKFLSYLSQVIDSYGDKIEI